MNDAAPVPFHQDPQKLRTVFLTVASAEAVSWLGLLIGMYLKRVAETTEVGVQVFGPIHGVIFVAYVVLCVLASRTFGWNIKTLVVALICSIPPFFTVVFELIADRRGLLGRAPHGATS